MSPILVVDDESGIVDMLVRFLKIEGHEALGFTNPKMALEHVRQNPSWLVISDLMMPEMLGIDFMREVKSIDPMIQLVAITGYVTTENILAAFRLGVNNCFFKPFESLEAIESEVQTALSKRRRINEVIGGIRGAK